MLTGTVKYVNPNGDYGFISRDDKLPKVFVHISTVRDAGFPDLVKGQRWAFSIVTDESGRPAATELQPI